MGWRKWTILDGDLARCSELQRPRRYAELRPWGSFNAAASQRGWSDSILSETGRAWGRAVAARWLCSDSRGLGIRTMLSSCGR
jgi:hypothetical protein